jgi:hypothetical protein
MALVKQTEDGLGTPSRLPSAGFALSGLLLDDFLTLVEAALGANPVLGHLFTARGAGYQGNCAKRIMGAAAIAAALRVFAFWMWRHATNVLRLRDTQKRLPQAGKASILARILGSVNAQEPVITHISNLLEEMGRWPRTSRWRRSARRR